jgi:hypothetical protein
MSRSAVSTNPKFIIYTTIYNSHPMLIHPYLITCCKSDFISFWLCHCNNFFYNLYNLSSSHRLLVSQHLGNRLHITV